MTKNLNLDTFQNGDPIEEITSSEAWNEAYKKNKPAWRYFNFDSSNKKYGKLYNWFAVSDSRGLAPMGWHIPSKNDWDTLIAFLGNGKNNVEACHVKAHDRLKSNFGWSQLQFGKKRSGFNAKPGGAYDPCCGTIGFKGLSSKGIWWSTTGSEKESWDRCPQIMAIQLNKSFWDLNSRNGRWFRETIWSKISMDFGLSVRCVQNSLKDK